MGKKFRKSQRRYKPNLIWHTLLVALAYLLTAKSGLLLSNSSNYASAIWPASGIALAALMLYGVRLWPGIFIGAFLTYFLAAFAATTPNINAESFIIAVSLALLATLQALIGFGLLRIYIKLPNNFDRVRDICLLLLLGGPIACTIGATLGNAVLYHVLAAENFWQNWLTWWVGNSIGVIIFTPLLYLLFSKNKRVGRSRKLATSVPLLVLFSLVVTLFAITRSMENATLQWKFTHIASNKFQQLKISVNDAVNTVHSIKAFYNSSIAVDDQQFRTFTNQFLERNKGIRAFEWIPYITFAERQEYETRAQQRYPNFQITELNQNKTIVRAGIRPEYFPVYYLHPYSGNEPALGLDLGSESTRLEAIKKARRHKRQAATAPIQLVQQSDTTKKDGYLVLDPIFQNQTLNSNNPQLLGFVLGVFSVELLVQEALQDIGENYWVRLIDITEGHAQTPIFVEPSQSSKMLNWSNTLKFGDRIWQAEFTPSKLFLSQHQGKAIWLMLIGSLLFTGLIGSFLLIFSAHSETTKRAVRKKTEEIRQTKADLELILNSTADGIYGVDRIGNITFANLAAQQMTGYRIDEMLGVSQHSLIHHTRPNGDIYLRSESKIYNVMLHGNSVTIDDEIFWRKDGSFFPVEYTSTPIHNSGGIICGAVVVFKDIIRRQRAEKERQNLLNELAKTNEELEKFAYAASHDLKSPLRAITHLTDWIEEDLQEHMNKSSEDNFILLRKRISRMEKLLDDLLDYSRLSRQDTFSQDRISGTEIFDYILSILPIPNNISVNIDRNVDDVRAPRMPLQQILLNIIDNAIKYNDKEKGRVDVSVDNSYDPDFYIFTIKDNGPGIEDQYKEKVFEIFQTLQSRDKIEGSGMGLAYAKRAVEASGGVIQFESKMGVGTTFLLSWPKPKEGKHERYAANDRP